MRTDQDLGVGHAIDRAGRRIRDRESEKAKRCCGDVQAADERHRSLLLDRGFSPALPAALSRISKID
jgi:hypothetical protein